MVNMWCTNIFSTIKLSFVIALHLNKSVSSATNKHEGELTPGNNPPLDPLSKRREHDQI